MDIRKLQRTIVDGLEDVKAQHISVFNTEHLSALFERVIIASGTSNRQTKALASSVREAVKGAGYPTPRTEGEANGEWIIIDCGAAVVHVMQPTIREYYHLEEIWGEKPVNLKLGTARKLVKASEPAAADATGTVAVARKASARKPRAAAEKTVPRVAVKRAGAAGVTRIVGTKAGAAAKKAPTRRAAAKKPMAGAQTPRTPRPAAEKAKAPAVRSGTARKRPPAKSVAS